MPQEKAAQTIILKQKATAEAILKALYTLAKELHDRQEYKAAHQTFIGETNFNQFMATSEQKASYEFKNSPVKLEKLKTYLTEKGVGFAYKVGMEETQLIFDMKNTELVKAAAAKVVSEIIEEPEEFLNKVLESPTRGMKLQDKISYYEKNVVYKGTTPVIDKQLGKGKEKAK